MDYIPTVLVHVGSIDQKQLVGLAIQDVCRTYQSRRVQGLKDGETEVDIVITNILATASLVMTSTKKTNVLLIYMSPEDQEKVITFSKEFPNRIEAVNHVGGDGHTALTKRLEALVRQKTKTMVG